MREPWELQQERADRQQAQAGGQGAQRTDGGDAERVKAEQDGRDQDQNEGQHAAGVPERASDETVFGACCCRPRPATADDCRCQLGALIDDILVTAYHCPPDLAADRVRRLITLAPSVLADVQADLIRRLAAEWTGTTTEFCKRYGYTRQHLHNMGVRWRKS